MALCIALPLSINSGAFHTYIIRSPTKEKSSKESISNTNNPFNNGDPLNSPSPDNDAMQKAVKHTTITSVPRQDDPIILSGWLYKMKRTSRAYTGDWNKRWMVIQNGALTWRHSKKKGEPVAGSISLSLIHSLYKIEPLNKVGSKNNDSPRPIDRARVLVVKSNKRSLCLMARSQDECDLWMRSLQLQLDLRDGGTSSGPSGQKNRRKSNGGLDRYDQMMKMIADSASSLKDMDEDFQKNITINSDSTNLDDQGNIDIKNDSGIGSGNNSDSDSVSENNNPKNNRIQSNIDNISNSNSNIYSCNGMFENRNIGCENYRNDVCITHDEYSDVNKRQTVKLFNIIQKDIGKDLASSKNMDIRSESAPIFFTKVRTSGEGLTEDTMSDIQNNNDGWQSDSSSGGDCSDIDTLILE